MVNGMTNSPNPMRQRSKVSSRELPSKDFDVSLRALFLMDDKALTSKSRRAHLRKVLHSCLRGPKDHIVVNMLNVQEASRGTGCLIFQAEVARGTGILHNLLVDGLTPPQGMCPPHWQHMQLWIQPTMSTFCKVTIRKLQKIRAHRPHPKESLQLRRELKMIEGILQASWTDKKLGARFQLNATQAFGSAKGHMLGRLKPLICSATIHHHP